MLKTRALQELLSHRLYLVRPSGPVRLDFLCTVGNSVTNVFFPSSCRRIPFFLRIDLSKSLDRNGCCCTPFYKLKQFVLWGILALLCNSVDQFELSMAAASSYARISWKNNFIWCSQSEFNTSHLSCTLFLTSLLLNWYERGITISNMRLDILSIGANQLTTF